MKKREAQIQALEAQTTENNTNVELSEGRIEELQSELKKREAQIQALEAQTTENNTNVELSEGRIEELQSELKKREAQIQALEAQTTEDKSNLEQMQGVLDAWKKALAQRDEMLVDAQAKLDQAREKVCALEREKEKDPLGGSEQTLISPAQKDNPFMKPPPKGKQAHGDDLLHRVLSDRSPAIDQARLLRTASASSMAQRMQRW